MTGKKAITLATTALTLTMTVCGSSTTIAASELTAESKPAPQYTIDANQEVYALLDFEDTMEFENATKGLIASPDTLDIYDDNGYVDGTDHYRDCSIKCELNIFTFIQKGKIIYEK